MAKTLGAVFGHFFVHQCEVFDFHVYLCTFVAKNTTFLYLFLILSLSQLLIFPDFLLNSVLLFLEYTGGGKFG